MSLTDAQHLQAICQVFPSFPECAPRLVSSYGLPTYNTPVPGLSVGGGTYTIPGPVQVGSPVPGPVQLGSPVAGTTVGPVPLNYNGTYTVPGAGFGAPYAVPPPQYTAVPLTTTNDTIVPCNDGFGWNGSNCVQTSAAEVTIGCHANQVTNYNTDTKTLICSNPVSNTVSAAGPSATQQKFTNVNGFKSRKCRNVESFSNANGKCKARY
jgi:hypothetical protein